MTKNEFLLNVAITAMGWGEGADFEMMELICENGEFMTQLEKHYNVKYCHEDDFDPEDENGLQAEKAWRNALRQCQKDAIALLRELKEPFECGIYAEQKMNDELALLLKNENNPQFYLRGKLKAINYYRHDKDTTLKEAFDHVTKHGWTGDGNYK